MENIKTSNIISTPNITGNIGSCTTQSQEVEKIIGDYGQVHEEECSLNTEDGDFDGCDCAIKSMAKEIFSLGIQSGKEEMFQLLDDNVPQYCTSGCGCTYPGGSGAHEYGCVWKEDTDSPAYELIKKLKDLLAPHINDTKK